MAVNLSMLAGAGAQFFDNNGNPLAGGKLYTYAAGTTTPQTTYTASAGNVAHANPIVLDSAGRVPVGGEIWLTDAVNYKFVLATSLDVTLGTYDNVAGNASGILAALAAPGGSALVGFLQAGTGAVARTAQSKMRDVVSVKDFGAVGDGVTDDTAEIQSAVTYGVANNKQVQFPQGSYKLTSKINVTGNVVLQGDGIGSTEILCAGCDGFEISAGVSQVTICDMNIAQAIRYTITPNSYSAIRAAGTTASQCYWHTYKNLFIDGFGEGFFAGGVCSSTWRNVTTVYTFGSVNFSDQCLNNAISQCRFGERDSGGVTPTAGSYGIKVGSGTINCEGLIISDSLIFGVRRGLWVNASINVVAHHNIFDMIAEFGILAQSTASAGCINNIFSENYIALKGASGDTAVYLVNSYAPTDSQNRGTVIANNEILAYPGSTAPYGILVDGAEEERNLITGNRVQNFTVYDCRITAGSNHRVSDNLWRSGGGFSTTVADVSYINNTGPMGSAYPSPIGSFTPVAIGTTTPGTGTYTTQLGTYKIIDKVCYFNARVNWTAHTGTGSLKIDGLPVPCANVAGYAPAVTVNSENLTYPVGATSIIALINTGATTVELRGSGNGLAPTPVDIDAAANINISGFYNIN